MYRLTPLLLTLACAPTTVDLVQPNAVSKGTFEGEWYWRDTVADAPAGSGATFTGAQSTVERITWRVEESTLIGYRAYEKVPGSDDVFDPDAALVAWPILKHFDIRRAYDPRTGEEMNVIEENTERPWYEREFMRVDWSRNLASQGTMSLAGLETKVSEWVTTDPSSEWAPQLDDSDGDGVIDHMQLHTRVLATPDSTRIPGYGDIPTCFLYGRATVDCNPTELVITSAFQRVEPTRAFVGLEYANAWMSTFGVFDTERLHYDRRYGVTEEEHVRWANRHDLWEDSLRRDELGRPLCKVKKEEVLCEQASVADDPKPSLIPYQERTPRPIAYHISNGFDERLLDTLDRLEEEWNAPLAETVNQLRYWECIADGKKAERCEQQIDPGLQMFILCRNNPSLPGDPEACSTDHTGPQGRPDGIGDVVRDGDLRYNLISLVGSSQQASPLGYGPSAVDPTGARLKLADGQLDLGAGEILSANLFIYMAPLDRIATATTDLIRLIDGDLPEDELIEGENVQAWVDELRDQGTSTGLVGGFERPQKHAPLTGRSAAREALDSMDGAWSAPLWSQLRALGRPSTPAEFPAWLDATESILDSTGLVQPVGLQGRLAWEQLTASPFDEVLWTPESIAAAGVDPQLAAADPALLTQRSPLDPLDPARAQELEAGLLLAGQHAVDLDHGVYSSPSLVGMAAAWRDEGLSYEQIFERIRDETFVATTLHEIGHTMGLRHNFAGSTDAWNYDDQYWKLRAAGRVAPRHVDPETPEELNAQIREFQYSSIMDYPGEANGDWHGLGRYDHAAIRFIYGQLVEVMTEIEPDPVLPSDDNATAVGYVSYFYDSPVYPAPILGNDDGLFELHYTDYPRIANLQARTIVPYSRLVSRLDPEDPAPGLGELLVVADTVDDVVQRGLPAAPYRFCSDELAGQGMCARFDAGADPYEIVSWYTHDYFDRYVLDNFARSRYGFGFGDYAGRMYGRTFRPLQSWTRNYALFHTILGAAFDPQAQDYLAADKGLGGWTQATADTFRFLTQVIARPEPGEFGASDRPDGVRLLSRDGADAEITLPLGTGAYYDSNWEDDAGYWWFERYSRIGTYWDRILALEVLTTLSPYDYVGFDTASDPRTYALGFATLWRDPLTRYLGSLVADDVRAFAPAHHGDAFLQYPDPTRPSAAWPPADTGLVTPGAYWLVRYSAGLFASGLLQEGFDHSWIERARIYAEGSDEAITPPAHIEVTSFADPLSGITWSAWRYPSEDGVELGAGARLLDVANTLGRYCSGEAIAPYTDAADPAALAWQEQLTCAELRKVVSDIELQSRINDWFSERF